LKNTRSENIDLKSIVGQLSDSGSYNEMFHEPLHGEELPSTNELEEVVELLRQIIFPGFFGNPGLNEANLQYYMGVNVNKLYEKLYMQVLRGLCFECKDENRHTCKYECTEKARKISVSFIAKLPKLRHVLCTDVKATYDADPAAKSIGEIIFCYPGIRAITNYRIAHELLFLKVPLIPRIISEMAHSETGIDIHPGAKIDEFFTIDHGTGVVIGETCEIGKNVRIYQGVTLGAKSFPVDEKGKPIKGIPRHPVLEDNVIIYSQATILGRTTVGKNSVIGGNVWVTHDLPPNSKVVQRKAKEGLFSDGGGI
jgi:serine O-acetyltransferase